MVGLLALYQYSEVNMMSLFVIHLPLAMFYTVYRPCFTSLSVSALPKVIQTHPPYLAQQLTKPERRMPAAHRRFSFCDNSYYAENFLIAPATTSSACFSASWPMIQSSRGMAIDSGSSFTLSQSALCHICSRSISASSGTQHLTDDLHLSSTRQSSAQPSPAHTEYPQKP